MKSDKELKLTNSELKLMVEDIAKRVKKLSDWEIDFMLSIKHYNNFSKKEAEIINRIWDRVT